METLSTATKKAKAKMKIKKTVKESSLVIVFKLRTNISTSITLV